MRSVENPNDYRRAWHENNSTRVICINVGHKAYKTLAEYSDLQHDYLREQMLKQYILLYLAEGKFSIFDNQATEFEKLEPIEAVECVMDKIENVNFKSIE